MSLMTRVQGLATVGPLPKLWRCLVTEWIPLPHALAQAWWHALGKAQWSTAVEWRTTFLSFAHQDGWVHAEMVEQFFAEVAHPTAVFPLIAALMQEQVLLRRDGHLLEEALLRQMTAEGQWTHPRRTRREDAWMTS